MPCAVNTVFKSTGSISGGPSSPVAIVPVFIFVFGIDDGTADGEGRITFPHVLKELYVVSVCPCATAESTSTDDIAESLRWERDGINQGTFR